jgi:hypothetical protein
MRIILLQIAATLSVALVAVAHPSAPICGVWDHRAVANRTSGAACDLESSLSDAGGVGAGLFVSPAPRFPANLSGVAVPPACVGGNRRWLNATPAATAVSGGGVIVRAVAGHPVSKRILLVTNCSRSVRCGAVAIWRFIVLPRQDCWRGFRGCYHPQLCTAFDQTGPGAALFFRADYE